MLVLLGGEYTIFPFNVPQENLVIIKSDLVYFLKIIIFIFLFYYLSLFFFCFFPIILDFDIYLSWFLLLFSSNYTHLCSFIIFSKEFYIFHIFFPSYSSLFNVLNILSHFIHFVVLFTYHCSIFLHSIDSTPL